MNWRAIWAIVRKDIRVILTSKGVVVPLVLVPSILLVILPTLLAVVPRVTDMSTLDSAQGMDRMLAQLPAHLRTELASYALPQRFIVLMIVYYFAPMYLILPLMVASVIAADSIVGERERKTLEALLYTPTSDWELFAAKFLAAWLPAVAVAWIGFVIYGVVANTMAWPVMQRVFFPNPMWLLLAFWVAPAVGALGLGFIIVISTRVNTFQEAYQLGGVVVVPVVGLLIGQAAGLLYFSTGLVVLLGLSIWLFDLALFWIGGRTLRRAELASRL